MADEALTTISVAAAALAAMSREPTLRPVHKTLHMLTPSQVLQDKDRRAQRPPILLQLGQQCLLQGCVASHIHNLS